MTASPPPADRGHIPSRTCWCIPIETEGRLQHRASPPPADALEQAARVADQHAERLKHTSHRDGLGMGWQEGEEVCHEIASRIRALAAAPAPGLDWRKAIADRPEWIGWDTVFCYWCDNTEYQGHAPDCVWVKAVRIAGDAE